MSIYKLTPSTKDYLWGGNRLKDQYHKISDKDIIAETWELSFHKDGPSFINGVKIEDFLSKEMLGSNLSKFNEFPVLIKYIDARENLSVQVHPNDDYAKANHNSLGKEEMWYIIDAAPGAGIYLGLNKDLSSDEFKKQIADGSILNSMNFIPVSKGDYYFIPSGTLHAIAKGCLICEVQQSSNITYRVYDYKRVGADGRERELHIDRALDVTNLNKFNVITPNKDKIDKRIATSKYFTTYEINVDGEKEISASDKSFACINIIDGDLTINNNRANLLDSYFLEASSSALIKGKGTVLVTKIEKIYVGLDIGGTNIKGGILRNLDEVIKKDMTPTEVSLGSAKVISNMKYLVEKLLSETSYSISNIEGIGIGIAGMIDSKNGIVKYSNNINWTDVHIVDELKKDFDCPIIITNDANAAALGEHIFASHQKYENSFLITLGTGVGSGIIINSKIFEGSLGAGAEFGHSTLPSDEDIICTCKRKNCVETLLQTKYIINKLKEENNDSSSDLYKKLDGIDITANTLFDNITSSQACKKILDKYLHYLEEALINVANIFRPEVIFIGGGVSLLIEDYINDLEESINKQKFGEDIGPTVHIQLATLKNDAGFIGAACLLN